MGVRPDFIFIGKTLAAGYGALSAVITSTLIEDVIRNVQGRLQHTTTHQAHSLGVAAALSVQKIIHTDKFLGNAQRVGEHMRSTLKQELGGHPFFFDVRGRGLRFSLEYQCEDRNNFGHKLQVEMEQKYGVLINAKWHRVCFTPALILEKSDADYVLEAFISVFKRVASNWKA